MKTIVTLILIGAAWYLRGQWDEYARQRYVDYLFKYLKEGGMDIEKNRATIQGWAEVLYHRDVKKYGAIETIRKSYKFYLADDVLPDPSPEEYREPKLGVKYAPNN